MKLRAALAIALVVTGLGGPELREEQPPKPASPKAALLDEPAAAAKARAERRPVEVSALTTETRQVRANPNGTFTLEQHTLPVRVRRGAGWVPVDTTLRRAAGGTVAPVASALGVTLSGGGADVPLLTLRRGGASLSLRWPGSLPEPVLDGHTATYPDVLPGVDLQVKAEADSVYQALVVKTREAGANPALHTVSFGLAGTGVTFATDKNGVTRATDKAGKVVFTGGTPYMWDSRPDGTPGEPGRKRVAVPMSIADGRLTLRPDRELLAAPDTRYPVYIDPPWTGGTLAWTMIEGNHWPGQSYWAYGREEGAKSGHIYDSYLGKYVKYRAMFRIDTSALHGKNVTRATFQIYETRASSCDTSHDRGAVELRVIPVFDAGTTWSNSHTWFDGGYTDRRNWAKGYNGNCPAGDIEFNALSAAQAAAANHWPNTHFGIKAGNEGDTTYSWKRFRPDPVLITEYNSYPNPAYNLATEPNMPCVRGAGRPVINTRTPTLRANLSDPDNTNVFGRFEWWAQDGGGPIVHHQTGWGPNGTQASVKTWGIGDGGYKWRVLADDGTNTGPWSEFCEFEVDTVPPATAPVITGSGLPGEADCCVPVGTKVDVTFEPNGEPGVTGYYWGWDANTTNYVKAGSDGKATVPITVWQDGPAESNRLFVRSVDRAGNRYAGTPTSRSFGTSRSTVTPKKVRGDVDGDGRADAVSVEDLGYGETGFYITQARGNGAFYRSSLTHRTGQNSAWAVSNIRSARGDFNGDGLDDIAVLRNEGSARATLWIFPSYGTGYCTVNSPRWDSGAWNWDVARSLSLHGADVNGDGKDDLTAIYDYGGAKYNIFTWFSNTTGAGTGIPAPHCQPVTRNGATVSDPSKITMTNANLTHDHPAGWADANRVKMVMGDFNGDDKEDVAHFYDYGDCQTRMWVAMSDGAQIGEFVERFDSGKWNWCWHAGNFVSGDFTGDGKDDVANLHMYAGGEYKLWVFPSTGPSFGAPQMWWYKAGGWADLGRMRLFAADTNMDSRADVYHFYDAPDAGAQMRVHQSVGTTFVEAGAGSARVTDLSGLADGTTLWATDSRVVYKMAGGAPLPLGPCSLGLCGAPTATYQSSVDAAPKAPRAGTLLKAREYANETLYEVVDGQIDHRGPCPGTDGCDRAIDVHQSSVEPLATPVSNRGPTYGQLTRFVNGAGEHLTTNGTVWSGYRPQQPLGHTLKAFESGTTALYFCMDGGDTFSSTAADCEGKTKLTSLGWIYQAPPAGQVTAPLYRCKEASGERFDSLDAACEGKTLDLLLGHVQPYASLTWYHKAYGNWESWTTTLSPPSGYRPQWPLGQLSLVEQPGTVPMYSCLDGTDEFSSLDAGCEGKQKVARLGWVWQDKPEGLVTVALYRCRYTTSGDRFTAHNADCAGQESLDAGPFGYVLSRAPLARTLRGYDHRGSTGALPSGYRMEGVFGYLSFTNEPNTRILMSCQLNWDEFLSLDPNCEGQQVLRPLGWIWTQPPAGVPYQAIYRCLILSSGEHFTSVMNNCEGEGIRNEGLQGYVRTRL